MSISQMTSYKILFKKEPEGGYTVTVPSLPGCVTYVESTEETIELAKEIIELYIESSKAHHEKISKISLFDISESYKNTGKKRVCKGTLMEILRQAVLAKKN